MRIKRILAVYLLASSVVFNSLCFTEKQKNVDAQVIEPVGTKVYSATTNTAISESLKQEKHKKVSKKKKYIKGWTTTSVNVRKRASTDSKILDTYPFNTKVQYSNYNKNWFEIRYGNKTAYMYKDFVSDVKAKYKDYSVPSNSGFKSYMHYGALTSTSSKQYLLQQRAYTGKYGIRQVNGRYCVAIGSYFNSRIGTMFDLILENGTVIPCIMADQKSDNHTDSSNIITKHNGCLSEFIVNVYALNNETKKHGDISYCNDKWRSPVKKVRVYENASNVVALNYVSTK